MQDCKLWKFVSFKPNKLFLCFQSMHFQIIIVSAALKFTLSKYSFLVYDRICWVIQKCNRVVFKTHCTALH